MKKPTQRTNTTDPPKPVGATLAANEKDPQVALDNFSSERLADGASKTTELLNEIFQRQMHSEAVRRWGINE